MPSTAEEQQGEVNIGGCCLACGGDDLHSALSLGVQPLANFLTDSPDAPYSVYPLGLMYCAACGHGQLSHFVPPAELFRHYLYASGTSGTLGAYFDWFRAEVERHFSRQSRILEIACNDGSLLRRLSDAGYRTVGVDPAENLVSLASDRGLEVIADFWPCPAAIGDRRFDLVIGMNVLAHNPTPLAFLQGVADVLADDGVCIVQTSQANMLANGEFDTIYHEHYSFFTPGSMSILARRAGLEVRMMALVDIHGTSFTFVLSKPSCRRDLNSFLRTAPFAVDRSGSGATEADDAVVRISGTPEQYAAFGQAARERMTRIAASIAAHRADGRRICFVGAAAKALTFMKAAGIIPDYIFDEAPLKIGRFVPGETPPDTRKIRALDDLVALSGPLLIVLSAWNFREELARKVRQRRLADDYSFLVYFPEIEEFS